MRLKNLSAIKRTLICIVSIILTAVYPNSAWANTTSLCIKFYSFSSPSHPPLPDGAIVLKRDAYFVIYQLGANKRILFDTRQAEIGYVDPKLHNNEQTQAMIDPNVNKVVIIQGRHRAVSASNGFIVHQRLGGTSQKYWLDYTYEYNEVYLHNVDPLAKRRPLVEVAITWNVMYFE